MTTWIGSPNFTSGRQGVRPDSIVIHWMVGNLASTDSVFQNTSINTSAHYGVENNQIHQYVNEDDTAYHAGNWNFNLRSIGIEHSAAPGRPASDGTYEDSANLIADIVRRRGISLNRAFVRRHGEIVSTQCCGDVSVGRLIGRAAEILGGAAPAPQPAPAPAPIGNVAGQVQVTALDGLNVRSAPNSGASIAGSRFLPYGTTVQYAGAVQGQAVAGVSTWLKSIYGNYFWAGGTNYSVTPPVYGGGGRATVQKASGAYVRSAPSTSAPLAGSQLLAQGQWFDYVAIVAGENVAGNNRWLRSTKGNYVWSGGLVY